MDVGTSGDVETGVSEPGQSKESTDQENIMLTDKYPWVILCLPVSTRSSLHCWDAPAEFLACT